MSTNQMDLDAILESSIEDLADLPEFVVYPAGVHSVTIQWESKTVNNHPCMELKMKAVETIELANPATDTPLTRGTEAGCLFMLDNEFGQGAFKSIIKTLAAATGTNKISEAVEASNGMEVQVVTKVRMSKDKSQSYTDVKKVLV
jgi:hypothetical protein